jgi:hypothetical protein
MPCAWCGEKAVLALKTTLITAAVLFSLAALAGCGGSPVFPDYRPEDYPPAMTTLAEEAFGLEPGSSVAVDFHAPEGGKLIATVDWTHVSNNVVAALAAPSCASVNLALAGQCRQGLTLAQPSTCSAKPRTLTASIAGASIVRLYVANAGASPESGQIRVVLCRDAPGCASSAACGQCILRAIELESCH